MEDSPALHSTLESCNIQIVAIIIIFVRRRKKMRSQNTSWTKTFPRTGRDSFESRK